MKADQVREQYYQSFPLLKPKWYQNQTFSLVIKDPEFEIITLEELKRLVEICSVKDLPYLDNINECEDFSLHFMSKIRRYRVEKGFEFNIALGWFTGFRIDLFGAQDVHDRNACITSDGIFLIEPQSDEIFDVNLSNYNPFWGVM